MVPTCHKLTGEQLLRMACTSSNNTHLDCAERYCTFYRSSSSVAIRQDHNFRHGLHVLRSLPLGCQLSRLQTSGIPCKAVAVEYSNTWYVQRGLASKLF